ncbi:MAG: phosphoglucosamine mutase [Candidatus Bathyarchaeota archaeon]|nr:phosphoglucosamine mutase [Candidatus Bathyarchaeota archaeon]
MKEALKKLFGSSGVRGIVNNFLTPELVCKLGLAAASQIQAKKAIVGRDTRASGLMLKDALISGLIACGVEVKFLSIVPTPVLAYLTKKLNADLGFMLTASHNPAQYNGIKIFDKTGLAYSDEKQKNIENRIKEKKYILANWQNVGNIEKIDATFDYLEMVKKIVSLKKNWKLVIDPGCGATFSIGPKLLQNCGCNVTTLNAQPDGTFPARKSEPTKESLKNLSQIVKVVDSDIGIAFDGDGDRVAFIDKDGKFVNPDRILAAFAGYVLRKIGGGIVVTNIEASMCFETIAKKFHGKVIRTRVGDVYLSKAIKKNKAVFGGEPCGAWIHPQVHYCPDGLLSGILLLKALEEEDKALDEFIAKVPKLITLRENIFCSNRTKNKILKFLKEKIRNAFPNFTDISTVDGIRVSLENGWILIRASGTEPFIRLTVEGESIKIAKDILERGLEFTKENLEV